MSVQEGACSFVILPIFGNEGGRSALCCERARGCVRSNWDGGAGASGGGRVGDDDGGDGGDGVRSKAQAIAVATVAENIVDVLLLLLWCCFYHTLD